MAEPTIQLGGGSWAGKTDNLLGYYKEGERFYKQDFTFSRSTTGTRVNSSGLIETASVLGSDLVTNGNFATDSDWTKGSGWTISGGTANQDNSTPNSGDLTQSNVTTSGKKYKVTFDLVVTSGTISVLVGGHNLFTSSGTKTFIKTATSSNLTFRNYSNFVGSIDNVSVKEVIENDIPRVDYLNNSKGSLILEPQRTNLVTQSEDFSGYSGGTTTIVINQATAPDGSTSADKIYPSASGNFVGKYLNIGASTTGVVSCFVKQANKRYAILGTDNSTFSCIFDLQTGTVSSQATNYTAKIENYGNGWYRISAAYTASAAAPYPFIGVADSTNGSVTKDGTNGLFIWGFQYELNASYPTSYIPTSGSSVTRNADVINQFTLNYGNTFSALFDFNGLGGSSANNFIMRIGSTNPVYLSVRRSDKKLQFYSAASGVGYFATIATQKIAISCNGTNWIWSSDGVSGTLTATGEVNAQHIRIASDGATGGGLPSALVNKILLFNTALTAQELNVLTTL